MKSATKTTTATPAPFTIPFDPATDLLRESNQPWIIGNFTVEEHGETELRLIKDGWYITVNKDNFIKAVKRWQVTSCKDFVAGETSLYVQKQRNGFVEVEDPRDPA